MAELGKLKLVAFTGLQAATPGNPPVRSGLSEVEFSPMEEVLHEEVPF